MPSRCVSAFESSLACCLSAVWPREDHVQCLGAHRADARGVCSYKPRQSTAYTSLTQTLTVDRGKHDAKAGFAIWSLRVG